MKTTKLILLTPFSFLLCSCPDNVNPPKHDPAVNIPVSLPVAKMDEKLISFKGIKAKVPKSTVQKQTMNDNGYELLDMRIDGYLFKFAQLGQDPASGEDYQTIQDNFKGLKIEEILSKPARTLKGENTLIEYHRFNGMAVGVIKHQGIAILRFTFTGNGDTQSQEELDVRNAFFDNNIKPILLSTTY